MLGADADAAKVSGVPPSCKGWDSACNAPVCAGGGSVCVAPVVAGGETVSLPSSRKGRDAVCSVPVGAGGDTVCVVPVRAGGGTVCVAPVFAGGESVCSVPPSCKGRDAVCSVPVGAEAVANNVACAVAGVGVGAGAGAGAAAAAWAGEGAGAGGGAAAGSVAGASAGAGGLAGGVCAGHGVPLAFGVGVNEVVFGCAGAGASEVSAVCVGAGVSEAADLCTGAAVDVVAPHSTVGEPLVEASAATVSRGNSSLRHKKTPLTCSRTLSQPDTPHQHSEETSAPGPGVSIKTLTLPHFIPAKNTRLKTALAKEWVIKDTVSALCAPKEQCSAQHCTKLAKFHCGGACRLLDAYRRPSLFCSKKCQNKQWAKHRESCYSENSAVPPLLPGAAEDFCEGDHSDGLGSRPMGKFLCSGCEGAFCSRLCWRHSSQTTLHYGCGSWRRFSATSVKPRSIYCHPPTGGLGANPFSVLEMEDAGSYSDSGVSQGSL